MELKSLGISDGDQIKLHDTAVNEPPILVQENVTKKDENKLAKEEKNYNELNEDVNQERNQNYVETERSEEVWKEIMKLYHMGEGMQGIFNGCSNIIECRKKLKELQGLLEALLERNNGPTNAIDKKITMVVDTIA